MTDDAFPPDDRSAVRRALADAVDRRAEILADWSSREPNAVALVGVGDERVVCKVARDGDGERIRREAAATAHANRETGLAPEVLAHGTGDDAPPYLVTRCLPGAPPAETWGDLDPDTDPDRFRRIGAALAAVHGATRREDCGPIVGWGDGEGPVEDGGRSPAGSGRLELAGPGSWHATLLELTRRRVADLEDTRFEALGREALACVARHPAVERGARPALVHNDPGPYNAVLDGDRVEGLIDWELALCGDAAYDLVWVETAIRDGPADLAAPDAAVEALYDGYRDRLPRREEFPLRRATYRLVRGLRPLRTFDSWGPSLAADRPETVGELADRARETVRERVDAVDREGSA